MTKIFEPETNYDVSRQQVGYVERADADAATYSGLGFKCGLEVHQQLNTGQKLFCRCPAGIFHGPDNYNAEVIRHMRPTLSELGEYDGTALMEFKTRKNITYRLNNQTACTYDIDDTPPFPLNRDALGFAIEIALLLKTNIVGELHITRKQYLDGSIPTGFQRTAIVGIEGEIPISNKKIRIIQLGLEEDSCREVSDTGHWRTYTTDRLGTPLVETVTYPDMLTPDEAAEAGHYIRFLTRSTGKVRSGIGAARQDVNVSITGGTRVEIKGVAHIKWIPALTHNEAFRQNALLHIQKILKQRVGDPEKWKMSHVRLSPRRLPRDLPFGTGQPEHTQENGNHHDGHHETHNGTPNGSSNGTQHEPGHSVVAVNLPHFKGILSFFTQPGKSFSNELSDRLKVIACIEKPNMVHSEPWDHGAVNRNRPDPDRDLNRYRVDFSALRKSLKSGENDAQLIIGGPEEDIETALETIKERCLLAFGGVPNETRKSLPDGTTLFERVLPGPDRMYPDTDSPPISIGEEHIRSIRGRLPVHVSECIARMNQWNIPAHAFSFILKRNLFSLLEKIVNDFNQCPVFTGTLIGCRLKHIEGRIVPSAPFDYNRIYDLFSFIIRKKLKPDIIKHMLPVIYQYPNMDFESVLTTIDYRSAVEEDILSHLPVLIEKFYEISHTGRHSAMVTWVMGKIRPMALGNMALKALREKIEHDHPDDGLGQAPRRAGTAGEEGKKK